MECLCWIHPFYPLLCNPSFLNDCQIPQANQHKTFSFIYFPLVGMVGVDHRYGDVDIGVDTIFLVCQVSAPHVYTAMAFIYPRHQCILQKTNRTMHDPRSYPAFSFFIPRQRCILVVFWIPESIRSELELYGGSLWRLGVLFVCNTLLFYGTAGSFGNTRFDEHVFMGSTGIR